MNKSTQLTMFSSKTGEWATPQEFFNKLDWRFGPFDLDPCADPVNTKWIAKAYKESREENTKVVMLIPARTDTKYWHNYVMKADEVYFVKGRLKFGDSENSAPFPSAVVVFEGSNRSQIFGTIKR